MFHNKHDSVLCAEQCCTDLMFMAKEARKYSLGPLHPAYNLVQIVQDSLRSSLPADAHVRASGRLCVSLTRVSDRKNVLVSEFNSREELVEVHVPARSLGWTWKLKVEQCWCKTVLFPGPCVQLFCPFLLWCYSSYLQRSGEWPTTLINFYTFYLISVCRWWDSISWMSHSSAFDRLLSS